MPNLFNFDDEHNTIRLTARSGFDLFKDQHKPYRSNERDRAETQDNEFFNSFSQVVGTRKKNEEAHISRNAATSHNW